MEKPGDLRGIRFVQIAFLVFMRAIIKQKNKLKKSSKHSKELSKLKIRFIEYYSKLPIQKLAAEFIGKSEDSICDWKNNDKNFANQITSAKSAWALEKAGKVRSVEWLLERVMKEHFSESVKVEHGVNEKLEAALDKISSLFP